MSVHCIPSLFCYVIIVNKRFSSYSISYLFLKFPIFDFRSYLVEGESAWNLRHSQSTILRLHPNEQSAAYHTLGKGRTPSDMYYEEIPIRSRRFIFPNMENGSFQWQVRTTPRHRCSALRLQQLCGTPSASLPQPVVRLPFLWKLVLR